MDGAGGLATGVDIALELAPAANAAGGGVGTNTVECASRCAPAATSARRSVGTLTSIAAIATCKPSKVRDAAAAATSQRG